MVNIQQICQDLNNGSNYPGVWHGFDWWGKASDFHEHPFFIWETIQKVFDISKPLNIIETGRCTGQSTNLFSGIAELTKGYLYSFDIDDWNRNHIININNKYGITDNHYKYIVDSSLNADKYIQKDFKAQIVFLDSLHSYELVKNETLLFEKYLDNTSIIFFHDTVWCFDTVMGWIKDYFSDKEVCFAKHQDTHKPQCEYCNRFNQPGLPHGRPIMMPAGRPNFQSPYDQIELSPHFNILTDDFIKWSDISFNDALKLNKKYVFTHIEANCGIGCLIIKK